MKKIIGMLLVVVLLIAAAGSVSAQLQVGNIVTMGAFEQDNDLSNGPEPIEWQVLAVESDRALVISWYGLDAKAYNDEWVNITWENCTLRAWLNGEFYSNTFSSEEQSRIRQVTNKNPNHPEYGTVGGNDTQDRIFLLSIDEAQTYFASDKARLCYATDYAKSNGAWVSKDHGHSWWWLRSPGDDSRKAAYIHYTGSVDSAGSGIYFPIAVVRPAFWLDLNSMGNSDEP